MARADPFQVLLKDAARDRAPFDPGSALPALPTPVDWPSLGLSTPGPDACFHAAAWTRRNPPGAVPEALAAIALTIPMLIAVVALAPMLLIGSFLAPAHQRFVLRLLDSLRQWSLIIHGRARRDHNSHAESGCPPKRERGTGDRDAPGR